MATHRRRIGNRGEQMAADFLQGNGLRVVARQKYTDFGEIDLVCRDENTWVFVEVKTRTTDTFGPPESAITPKKFRHMVNAAKDYLRRRCIGSSPWRIDVVSVRLRDPNPPEITHFPAVDTPYGH